MMRTGPFIRELCVALEHRWIPEELFLLFTAYFDEADTHGQAPTVIMAVILAHASQWEIFGRRLRGIQRDERFSIFHGKEIKHINDEQRDRRIVEKLGDLVRDELTEGLLIHLSYGDYVSYYKNSFKPKGISDDSQYGVRFRLLLIGIINNPSYG